MTEEHLEPKSGSKVLIIILVVLAAGCLGCGGIVTLIFFGTKGAVQDAMEGARQSLAEGQATKLRDHLHALELRGKVPADATADDVARIVRAAVRSAGDVPVTIKVRKGIDPKLTTFLDAGHVADLFLRGHLS